MPFILLLLANFRTFAMRKQIPTDQMDDNLIPDINDSVTGTSSTPTDSLYEGLTHLEWNEHIRLRPGMYIGKLGDGTNADDGIYVLLKETIDNSIDEFTMGFGSKIIVDVTATSVSIRDFGRGIPLNDVVDAVSRMNTGAKYDNKAFKKSVGLNGVGLKAVNALSSSFEVRSVRNGMMKTASFSAGVLLEQSELTATDEPTGTLVRFTPDDTVFRGYTYDPEHIIPLLKNYTYLNTGLTIIYNGKRMSSRGGLLDLLKENMSGTPLYDPIYLRGDDIEIAFTHANRYGEEYYTFVNGQHTTQGGTHLTAFKEAVSRTIKEFFGKNFDYADIRNGIIAAVAIKVEEPVFESQTKTKLGSRDMGPDGPTVAKFIGDFLKRELDNFLHRNTDTIAKIILEKIQKNEQERKEIAGVAKIAREKAKKVSINNEKLFDCRVHLSDTRGDETLKQASSIFITEGDSATGSITKIRDVNTQAVFSLRGKPLNTFGLTRKVVYINTEFNLLQAALNIEDNIDNLRYNNVIIATDADVDGMHIRLLLITFFLQFFPDLIRQGHLYVLQTPLFRVRNKQTSKRSGKRPKTDDETYYCYTDQERLNAIDRLGTNAEITRFKGLGEISPDEFREFIGENMRLDRVTLKKEDGVDELLEFYMGKNTPKRQDFIIENLIVEDDTQIS